MATRSLGTLTLDLILKSGGFETAMEKSARTTKEKTSSIASDLTKVGLGVAAAGAAAATAAVVWTKNMAQMGADVSKLAELSGVSAERFQELAYGAKSVGIEQDKLGDIFKDVQDKVGDFMQTGAGPLADFFEKIGPKVGVTAKQFKGLSGPDALGLYVSSLEKAGVSQAEMTFYMEAIASDATLLLPLLKNNAQGFKELGAEAHKFGAILNDDAIKAGKDLQRNLQQLDAMWDSVSVTLGNKVLPVLSGFVENSIKAWTETDELKGAVDSLASDTTLDAWMEGIGTGLAAVADVAVALAKTLGVVAQSFKVVAADVKVGLASLAQDKTGIAEFFNPEEAKKRRDEYETLVNERNQIVLQGNKSLEDLWNYQGDRFTQAFKKSLEDRKAALLAAANFVGPPVPTTPGGRGPGTGTGTKPITSTSTDAFLAGIRAQIAEQDALTKSLQVYGLEAAKVNAGDKLMLQLQQQLGLAQADRSGKVSDATLKEAMGLAALLSIRTRDNEQLQKSLELAASFTEYRKSLSLAEIELGQTLADTAANWGKTAEEQQIATAQAKIYRDAEKQIDAVLKAGLPGALNQIKAIEDTADAHAAVTAALMGRTQAELGAQELYGANQRFAAESIIDERERAAALLEIDANVWRRRIKAAGDGTEEQKKLIEQFNIWYANQQRLPIIEMQKQARQQTIDSWMETIDGVGDVFRQGFADMLNGGEDAWKSFTKSLTTTFKTLVADSIYKMLAKPFIVQLVAGVAGLATGDTKIADQIVKQSGATGDSLFGGTSVLSKLLSPSSNSSYNPVADNVAGMSATGNALYGAITDFAWNNIGSGGAFEGISAALIENSEAIAGIADAAGGVLAYGGAIISALNGDFGAAIGGAIGAAIGGPFAPITSFIGAKLGSLLDGDKSKPGVGTYGIADIGAGGKVAGAVQDDAFFYGDRRGYQGMSGALVSATANLGAQITQLAKVYGGDASGLRVGMQSAYSPDGKGANVGTLLSRDGVGVFGTAIEGANDALQANTALVIERSLLGGLQASKLEEGFAEVLNGVNISEATQEVVDGLKGQLQAVKDIKDSFVGLGQTLPYLSELGWKAQEMLVNLSGGLDQFKTNVSTYYQAFHTENERAADSLGQMTNQLALLGLELPDTRDEYRALVEAQDTATLSGQLVTATLFEMAGQFDAWATYAEDAAQKVVDAARDAAAEQSGIVETYLGAVLNGTEKLERQGNMLRDQFTALGVAMPDSIAGLRALVGAQDPLTEAGKKLRTALMKAAPALVGYIEALEGAKPAEVPASTPLEDFEKKLSAVQVTAQKAASALSSFNAAGDVLDTLNAAMGKNKSAGAAREQALWAALQTASLDQQVELAGELSQLVIDRYQNERANLESLIDLGKSLRNYVQGLRVGELSSLTLGQKLAEASKNYQTTLKSAQGGDTEALGALQGQAQTYLELARRYFASSDDYTRIFAAVTGSLDKLGTKTQTDAEKQLSVGQDSLGELQKLHDIVSSAYDVLGTQYQAAQNAAKAELAGLESMALKLGRLDDVVGLLGGLPAQLAAVLQPLLPSSNIDSWYQDILGRAPDEQGKEWWMNAGGATRDDFKAVAANEIALKKLYSSLGQILDVGGRDFWLTALAGGTSWASVEAEIRRIVLDGSHEGGLDYVPFDGYTAELHKGERVQTAAQARADDMARSATAASSGSGGQVMELLREIAIAVRDTGQISREGMSGLARITESTGNKIADAASKSAWANRLATSR